MKNIIYFILGLFLCSCTSLKLNMTEVNQEILSETSTLTPLVTGNQPTETDHPTPLTSTNQPQLSESQLITPTEISITKLIPSIISRCIDQNEIPWENMINSVDSSMFVLSNSLYLSNSPSAPLIISPGHSLPKKMNIPEEKSYFKLSPDQKWFSYLKYIDNNQVEVWIVSTDGTHNNKIISTSKNNRVEWLSTDEIILIGSPDAEKFDELEPYQIMPFLMVNPFTGTQKSIPYIATDELPDRYFDKAIEIDGKLYTLFYDWKTTGVEYYLYDYANEVSIPIFQWLKDIDPGKLTNNNFPVIWYYGDNQFAVVIDQNGGFDLALGLDLKQAEEKLSYNQIMSRVIVPEFVKSLLLLGINPTNNMLIFQNFDLSGQTSINNLISFDLAKKEIIKYCPTKPGSYGYVHFPSSDRFIAVDLGSTGVNGEFDYVTVLDLETGQIAYLPNYVLLDWYDN
jgi:hypothetical protein